MLYPVHPHRFDERACRKLEDASGSVSTYVFNGDEVDWDLTYHIKDVYNQDRDAKCYMLQHKAASLKEHSNIWYERLRARLETKLNFGKMLPVTELRQMLGREASIFRVIQYDDDTVTVYINPLDVYPRYPQRHPSGAIVIPHREPYEAVLDLSHDQWLWLREALDSAFRPHNETINNLVTKVLAERDSRADEYIMAAINTMMHAEAQTH